MESLLASLLMILSVNAVIIILIMLIMSPILIIILGYYLVQKVNIWEKSDE